MVRRRGRGSPGRAGAECRLPASSPRLLIPGLGVRLELLLEGCQLGEWRVRVGLPALLAPAGPFDEGRPELRIAIGTVVIAVAPALPPLVTLAPAAVRLRPRRSPALPRRFRGLASFRSLAG